MRIMCWRLLTEEIGLELIYLPGVNNIVANCLSRLEYDKDDVTSDHFALEEDYIKNIH